MRQVLLPAALLLATAPLRAAESPARLVPAIGAALRQVKGPMAHAAGKLGKFDFTVRDGRAHDDTLVALRPILEEVEARGVEALPHILRSASTEANRRADQAFTAYAQAFADREPRRKAIAQAEEVLIYSSRYLSSGRVKILEDIFRDAAQEVWRRRQRRLKAEERLMAKARQAAEKLTEEASQGGEYIPQHP